MNGYVLTQDGQLHVISDTELYHHGVKGMKWGVRRYQNKDGSLTSAGKKRRKANYLSEAKGMSDSELRSQVERMRLEKRYIDLTKNQSYKVSSALDAADKAAKAANSADQASKNVNKLRGNKVKSQSENKPDISNESIKAVSKSISVAKKVDRIAKEGKIAKRSKSKLDSMSDAELRDMVNRMDMEQQYSSLKKESVSRGKVTAKDVFEIAGDVLAVGASAAVIAVQIKNLRSK